MKANELMIGDWVLFNGNSKKVTSLLVTDLGVDQIYVFGNSCQVATISEYIEPIPLTAEIFEKNFRVDKQWGENGWYINDHIHIYQTTTGVYNIQYMEIVDIQYVHELQHALKLCGIDKEIEL